MTESKYGFLYIKLNSEYSHYFKGGFTECPERRLHDGFTEHLHKSTYETIYKITQNSSNVKCPDRIIFNLANRESICPNISKLKVLIKDGGTEFIDNFNKEIFKKCIEEDLLLFGITVEKMPDAEVARINETRPILNKEDNIIEELYKQLELTKIDSYENILRNKIQEQYVTDIINELNKYNRVSVKAPTGFGKTAIMYKTINILKPINILILTPRINLNHQFIDDKYTKYLNIKYNYYRYSNGYITNIYDDSNNIDLSQNNILVACYQSRKTLIKYIERYSINFDLVIFDEAHFISGWTDKIKDETKIEEKYLLNNISIKNRIFTTATPVIEMTPNIFGKVIEKVAIYELVNEQILCNIETIIKKLDNKKQEYGDLSKLIIKSMIQYNKKKGIVYVNSCKNAENLFKLMKTQREVIPYIYISKDKITLIDKINIDNDENVEMMEYINMKEQLFQFEKCCEKSVIIVVGKLGYGYDNSWIDFICFGDSRTSDIDIRQIVGRGLRWDKILYPNKILHILVPCYKNELNDFEENKALDAYMNYIISEYGIDNINKIIINKSDETNESERSGKQYKGEDIPIEIYKNWCTTGHNMFTKFILFLKINNINDEITYNKLKENHEWLISIGKIKEKYPKFGFRLIHPNNINYYWNKKDAEQSFEFNDNKLKEELGKEKYKKLDFANKLYKISKMDIKIPNIDFNLYYPNN